jgi:rhomboid protease GluP
VNDVQPTESSLIGPGASVDDAGVSPDVAAAEIVETKREDRAIPLWSYPATYTLMAINLVVFAVMFRYGPVPALVHQHEWSGILTAPFDIEVLERFGGSATWLVQHGQWWRLITSTFVHVSILHIALNMWCLWNLGLFGEPLLGRKGLVYVYLLTGTSGMMLSYVWSRYHGEDGLVAGASGAVFGIAGILIVLLSNRGLNLPWEELRGLRRQVIFFAVANLAIGMAPNVLTLASPGQLARVHLDPANLPRIDNTAHLGGFLSGLALGLPLFPRMTAGRASYRQRQRITFAMAALVLGLVGYALMSAG